MFIHTKGDSPREPSLVLILKWGGELTPAGRIQAEELGRIFRCMYPGGQGTVSIFTVFPSYGIFDVMFSYWFLRFCLFIWFDWLLYIFFYMCKSSMHVHVKISYMCFILSIAKKLVLRTFPSNPKIYFLWSYYFSVQSDFILNNKNQENNRVGRTVKYTGKFNIQTLGVNLATCYNLGVMQNHYCCCMLLYRIMPIQ